jgi:hypothetical protein
VRKILRLDVFSVAILFAVFYAAIELYIAMKSVLHDESSLLCPLGLELPVLHFTINITLKLPPTSVLVTPFFVIILRHLLRHHRCPKRYVRIHSLQPHIPILARHLG